MKNKKAKKGFWDKIPSGRLPKIGINNVLILALIAIVLSQNASTNTRIDSLFVNIDAKFEKMDGKFESKFDKMDKKFESKFEKIDQRFDKVDQRFDKIDQKFEAFDKKIEAVEKKFDEKFDVVNSRIDNLYNALNERIDDIYAYMREEFASIRVEFQALNRRIDGLIESSPNLKTNKEIKDRKTEESENSIDSPEENREESGNKLYDGEGHLSKNEESGGEK